MKKKSTYTIIPENELKCFWMDAGVTGFKLCDKQFQCEICEFDSQIRQRKEPDSYHTSPEPQTSAPHEVQERAMTATAIFERTLANHFETLREVQMPLDRMYNRKHFWIQQNEKGEYRIGMNHILSHFIQPVLSFVVLQAPVNIHRNDPFCWIILPGGAITLRSPIDATILRFNPAVQLRPNLLGTAPFEDGWIMEITTKSKNLNGFSQISESLQLTERLLSTVEHSFLQAFRHIHSSTGTTLFDGGTGLNSIETILGSKVYVEIVNRILHIPSQL